MISKLFLTAAAVLALGTASFATSSSRTATSNAAPATSEQAVGLGDDCPGWLVCCARDAAGICRRCGRPIPGVCEAE